MVEVTDTTSGEKSSATRINRLSAPNRSSTGGQVRQSFSGGKSKSVVVEKRRPRTRATEGGLSGTAAAALLKRRAADESKTKTLVLSVETPQPQVAEEVPEVDKKTAASSHQVTTSDTGMTLTQAEERARAEALAKAVSSDAQEAYRSAREATAADMRVAHEEAEKVIRRKAEAAAAEAVAAEEASVIAEASSVKDSGPDETDTAVKRTKKISAAPSEVIRKETAEDPPAKKGKRSSVAKLVRETDTRPRRQGKLTIDQALRDEDPRQRSLASLQRQRQRRRGLTGGSRSKVSRLVTLPDNISLQELASRMSERVNDVIKILVAQGQSVRPLDIIDAETAQLIAEEMGHSVKRVSENDIESDLLVDDSAPEFMESVSPVVTIMGHVDHGKTSLLDSLKESNVVAREAGGITQHIGAYRVSLGDSEVTFLDTPGHEAFTSMRLRGAMVTNLVVLVVAADDGVKPQTIEAINHAKAADVPIIVAINKMDLPDANPAQVRTELLQNGIAVESMGGEVLEVEISALKRQNLDKLLEVILLQAELLEISADPRCRCSGVVVDSRIERGRGPVATLLVQRGTLHRRDVVLAGAQWGKVRSLRNDRGIVITEAGPSVPVEVDGLINAPMAGETFHVLESEMRAREIAEWRANNVLAGTRAMGIRVNTEGDTSALFASKKATSFPLIIKADVQGAVEAVRHMIDKFDPEAVEMKVLHAGIGVVSESDVTLAVASNALILAFNVGMAGTAEELASRHKIRVISSRVIFELVDDARKYVSGQLVPEDREVWLGKAQVLEVFANSRVGQVAGCVVNEGAVRRSALARVIRDGQTLYSGPMASLRRYREEVDEVNDGLECGIALRDYRDFKVGDVIDCMKVEQVARTV